MPTDMEEAVRRSLGLRAAGVTPDPGTWRRVQQRIRRRRALGWAAGGVVVATIAVIATVALPALNGRQVRFVPPVVGRPAPTPSMAPDPTPAAGSLGGECRPQDRLALVAATSDGELVASCASGEEHPVVTDTLESEPSFSPEGTLLAFTRRPAADAPGRVVLLDLDSGEETDLGAGYGPAFGPDGQLAWLVDQPGDGTQPSIVVRPEPLGETLLQFPVFGDPAEEFTARHLAWDASGERLWWEAGFEGAGLWTAHLESEGPTPTRVEVSGGLQDSTYVTPSPSLANQVMVLQLCCVVNDGDAPLDAEIGAMSLAGRAVRGSGSGEPVPGEYQALQGLNELPMPLDLSGPLYTAAAGALDVRRDEEGRAAAAEGEPLWLPGDAPAWIVGDGNATYLVDGYGDLVQLEVSWSGVAVDPTFAPRTVGEGATPAPDPEPKEPTTATVQVYFGEEGTFDCTVTRAYERQVEAPAVARGALEALLVGPTAQERAQGATSFFSAETADLLNSVTITEGTARVDFDDRFGDINNASTSCGSEGLLSELDNTLKQFPTVDQTIYSLDGDVAAFYTWLQRVPPETAGDPGLPGAVQATVDPLLAAAVDRDYAALRELLPNDGEFTSNSGGRTDHIAVYREGEHDTDHIHPGPLVAMATLLGRLPPGRLDNGWFVWPRAAARPTPADWTAEERAELVDAFSAFGEQAVLDSEHFGAWLGWRVAIDPGGSWRLLVKGDPVRGT